MASRTSVLFAGGGTGGHLYPGLAIARTLVRLDPGVEPVFVGALRGIEKTVLPGTGFPHLLLDLHPLYRAAVWNNWKTLAGAASAASMWSTAPSPPRTWPPRSITTWASTPET